MPEISRFFGIVIGMFHDDHPPPHFHVYYAEERAIIEIDTMRIIQGRLSLRIYRRIAEWGHRHRAELRENWRRGEAHEALIWIGSHG